MTLGVDVGGTFTDLAYWDGRRLHVGKTSTTEDQADGVIRGAQELIGQKSLPVLLHGTTIATNTLLERTGARTALVTTSGFADVIEIGRQERPSLYDTFVDRPPALVPRQLRVEATKRDRSGQELKSNAWLDDLVASRPDAVAISLLYGFDQAGTETEIRDAIAARVDNVPISMGSQVAPEFREYERASTTVLNAYLGPSIGTYLRKLVARIVNGRVAGDVLVMRSSGGLMDAKSASQLAAAVVLSGPAGGVIASASLGKTLGARLLVSFDMGGTSTDVCRIDEGRPQIAYERSVGGYPCRMPSIDIHTVGAGGGSIGWIDPGLSLRVGPRSAGAQPGPACYARGGTEPTVTDANLVLGRLDPKARLAGSVPVRIDLARATLAVLGERLGMGPEKTALGILEVAEAHMERAIRTVSVAQGVDPRAARLVAFGGAGGIHATSLARRLEMQSVLVPPYAGVFSALGLLLSPPRIDLARSLVVTPERDGTELDRAINELADLARRDFNRRMGRPLAELRTIVDVRYRGQSHETPIPYGAGEGWPVLTSRFHMAHQSRNGFARAEDPIEVVTIRAEAVGRASLSWADLPEVRSDGEARVGVRTLLTATGQVDATVWRRSGLGAGDEVVGPAVIEEPEATTYLAAGERATVHPCGALEVNW
jgi:N-methylhydantoinase A